MLEGPCFIERLQTGSRERGGGKQAKTEKRREKGGQARKRKLHFLKNASIVPYCSVIIEGYISLVEITHRKQNAGK